MQIHPLLVLLFILSLPVTGCQLPEALIWAEEFDYTGLPDQTIWSYDVGDGCPQLCGWGNNELQFYTEHDPSNARVEEGLLIVEARKGENGQWTSARLKTQGKKNFTYGRIEIRAKVPGGAGTWPALWMLAEDITTDGWPACGEIDIMEHVGKEPGRIHSSLHSSSSAGMTENTGEMTAPDYDDVFHVYEAHWTPDGITFRLDGKDYYEYAPEVKNEETWPFNDDFFFIVNIAIGGNWGSDAQYETGGLKNGVAPGLDAVRMEVDYIRVYKP